MTYSCPAPRSDWRTHPGRVLVRIVCRWRPGCKPRNICVEEVYPSMAHMGRAGLVPVWRRWVRPWRGTRRES